MLIEQLRKDRRRAIDSYIKTIQELIDTGLWVKCYLGNKIVDNESNENQVSTDLSGGSKTPIKDYSNALGDGKLKELITTERFLYEDDLKRNPFLFESDDVLE